MFNYIQNKNINFLPSREREIFFLKILRPNFNFKNFYNFLFFFKHLLKIIIIKQLSLFYDPNSILNIS